LSNSGENTNPNTNPNQSLTFTEEGQPQQGQAVPPNNEAKEKVVDLTDKRKEQVADAFDEICIMAGRKNEHTFTLENEDGTKIKKRFVYHAASTGERHKITKVEERRAMSIRNVVEFATLRKRSKKDDMEIELFSNVDHELNYTMANIFLRDPDTNKGMSKEDYEKIPFTEINPVLQGYALRTERPLPLPLGAKAENVIT
jgi:hypothetical protein